MFVRLIAFILIIMLIMPNVQAFEKNKNLSHKNLKKTEELNINYNFDEDAIIGKVVKIKKGTVLSVKLLTPLDTSTASKNDEVEAILDEDLKIDGLFFAQRGSKIYGKITKAKSASYAYRSGKIKIKFNKIVTTDNYEYELQTNKIEFAVIPEDKWKNIAQTVIEIAVIAAGAIMTGGTLALFLACALASGVQIFPSTYGADAVIPAYTDANVKLRKSLNGMATY